jgi:hypothetical protein
MPPEHEVTGSNPVGRMTKAKKQKAPSDLPGGAFVMRPMARFGAEVRAERPEVVSKSCPVFRETSEDGRRPPQLHPVGRIWPGAAGPGSSCLAGFEPVTEPTWSSQVRAERPEVAWKTCLAFRETSEDGRRPPQLHPVGRIGEKTLPPLGFTTLGGLRVVLRSGAYFRTESLSAKTG